MTNNPQLLFVAGPNGAGKSTFSNDLSEPGAVIFDVDKVIARIEAQSPDMPKEQVYQAATDEFFIQVNQAVNNHQHFTLETNFRDDNLSEIVAGFRRQGYTPNMIYLTLENINQSVYRVNQRVRNSGHEVDHKNIELNYDLGLEHLERFADRFDNLEIIDASGQGFQLRSLLRVKDRKLEHVSDLIPERVHQTVNAIVAKFSPLPPTQRLRPGIKPKL